MTDKEQMELMETLLLGSKTKLPPNEQEEIDKAKQELDQHFKTLLENYDHDCVIFAATLFSIEIFKKLE